MANSEIPRIQATDVLSGVRQRVNDRFAAAAEIFRGNQSPQYLRPINGGRVVSVQDFGRRLTVQSPRSFTSK